MPRAQEGRAVHRGNAGFFQQRDGEILIGCNLLAARRGLADAAAHIRENIKRAFRLVAAQARRRVQHIHHQIAPAFIDLAHILNAFLRPGQRFHCRCLRHGRRVGG